VVVCFVFRLSQPLLFIRRFFLAVTPFGSTFFAFIFFIALYAPFTLYSARFGLLFLTLARFCPLLPAFAFFVVFSSLLPFSFYFALYCFFYYILLK
jgi:hypothetical protein